jgi:hypothetical protein
MCTNYVEKWVFYTVKNFPGSTTPLYGETSCLSELIQHQEAYLLSQTGNSNETPVYSDLPPNEIVD